MEENQSLPAISVDFVVEAGLKSKPTEAKRQPYISLISDWASLMGMPGAAEPFVSRLRPGIYQSGTMDENQLKMLLKQKYRDEESIVLLREILAEVDVYISQNPNKWTWAHVMRVMIDGVILNTSINSKFDNLICWLVPGKKKDSVRKNGDYMIMTSGVSWQRWSGDNSYVDNEAQNYMICKEIYQQFKKLIERQ